MRVVVWTALDPLPMPGRARVWRRRTTSASSPRPARLSRAAVPDPAQPSRRSRSSGALFITLITQPAPTLYTHRRPAHLRTRESRRARPGPPPAGGRDPQHRTPARQPGRSQPTKGIPERKRKGVLKVQSVIKLCAYFTTQPHLLRGKQRPPLVLQQ